MYSGEFLKFLYGYQKEEIKKKEPKSYEIRFKNGRGGKPAHVFVSVDNK